jgi:hypothetical protein
MTLLVDLRAQSGLVIAITTLVHPEQQDRTDDQPRLLARRWLPCGWHGGGRSVSAVLYQPNRRAAVNET